MGRKRKKNRSLPARVYLHHGSYRFVPKDGPKITLAKAGDHAGMLRALAQIIEGDSPANTLADLMNRYLIEVTPTKGVDSRRKEPMQMKRLRAVFGHFNPRELEQSDAYSYLSRRSQKAPTAARREIELLSSVCSKGAEWGALAVNPLLGMRKPKKKPRDRYVSNDEYISVWNLASPMIRATMDIAMLTGLRRGDILALTRASMTDDGLLVRPGKTRHSTNVELLFEWSDSLRDVLRLALAERPQVRQSIICNAKGKTICASTFGGAWNRLMHKAVEQGVERFEFRDLRRKSASDEVDAKVASERLGHSSQAITNRVYRVKPKRVRPLL